MKELVWGHLGGRFWVEVHRNMDTIGLGVAWNRCDRVVFIGLPFYVVRLGYR